MNNAFAQPSCLGTQGQLKWLLWEEIRDDNLYYLTSLHAFPNNPDAYETLTGIKSLGNEYDKEKDGNTYQGVEYGNFYGSMVRGYLKVTETGTYSFNLTGDNEVNFLLSTDEARENLVSQATISNWTYRKEVNDPEETNQTSPSVTLTAGSYYYFEVWHKEHSGGDHFEVLWKTPSNTTEWQDIPSDNLYDYACSLDCPTKGTPCDDGDVNTENDIQDGFCNCMGQPMSLPGCVGPKGAIKALYFLEIPGNSMSSFLNADKYPLMPDTAEILELFEGPHINRDTYGTKIAGYLSIPVTGDYQFTVTCDDRATFAISTDDTPVNLVEVSVANWSAPYNQYDEPSQIQDPVNLTKGNFYYFEMHHREGAGGDRYKVFWRMPYTQDTLWREFDDTYVYGYGCEMACIPEGTPCDDENNFTKNDRYDADCNCVGEPCRGADCDETPPLDYTPTAECGVGDKLDNTAATVWESCTPSPNPNAGRGPSHWIQYDLGQVYLINGTHIWNYNEEGATGKGFKEVVIDYSTDGTNWIQLGGIFEWAQATGTVGYEGFEGPNFNGINAQYILITALNNWNNDGLCSGFSKITIDATDCLLMGQACDDGDPNSVNDLYDEHCNCIGEGEGFNSCGPDVLVQGNIMLTQSEYRAISEIESRGIVDLGGDVKLIAGTSITLKPDFHAKLGSTFLVTIGNCDTILALPSEETTELEVMKDIQVNEVFASEQQDFLNKKENGEPSLRVMPNPAKNWTSIQFNLPYSTTASLCIYTTDGRNVICLSNDNKFEEGIHTKEFPAHRLAAGMYYVVLKTETEVLTKPLVVIQ